MKFTPILENTARTRKEPVLALQLRKNPALWDSLAAAG
jgi:hypothetical protein